MGFPDSSVDEKIHLQCRRPWFDSWVGKIGYPLQYSVLENSMDCIVHGLAKSRTGLSDFHFHFWASLVAQLVKNLPAMWETWVQSLN